MLTPTRVFGFRVLIVYRKPQNHRPSGQPIAPSVLIDNSTVGGFLNQARCRAALAALACKSASTVELQTPTTDTPAFARHPDKSS